MKKYWQVIKTTWQEYGVYRLNFLVWRLRSFIGFLTIYFFWWAVFLPAGRQVAGEVFGWHQEQILTYILGVAMARSIVLSSRTIDVGGEINQGNLTNYLLKPLNFLTYWFSRDIADKLLNIALTIFELTLFFLILKPPFLVQTNPFILVACLLSIILATILYFFINFFLGVIAFWTPESWSGVWGPRFVFTIILEFFAGTIFPLDILPKPIFAILQLTPFPYLIYFPLKIYLGQVNFLQIFTGFTICLFWMGIWYLIVEKTWRAGLKVYAAEGR
ncbi:ABC-2 family transporter protein [Candidatus Gottesmanbacteria bacterium]|nr:ABC-2 family transporter protein [Candidatus Gottesmanbacteria bacterium]